MNAPRILLLTPYFGFPSHFIPLVKLYQKMAGSQYELAFLLPSISPTDVESQRPKGFNEKAQYYYGGEFLSRFDLPVLDLKQQFSVRHELAAYRKFAPDLIVDDSNLTTALARQIRWRPRLAIARNGVFGDSGKVATYRHSLESIVDTLTVPPRSTFVLPQSLDGYFEAEAHIVPAIRSLEPMPGLPESGTRAFYSGPLLLDEREEGFLHCEALSQFFESNRGRRIAYMTFGIDASRDPHSRVWGCFIELLRRDFAVVTNLTPPKHILDAEEFSHGRYFQSNAVPMHYVCSRANLIVHVCGSATYHYAIIHGRPAITIGTQCRDREEVAQMLCNRRLSYHLPAPTETGAFREMFVEALNLYESGRFPFDEALQSRLSAAHLEIERTAALFDINAAIDTALSAAPVRNIGVR
jgi:hypothetical protein